MSPTTTLAEELARERERCQALLDRQKHTGPHRLLWATLLRRDLHRAAQALAEHDTRAMESAFAHLQEHRA
jgi:hypothetical protein